MNRVMGGTNVKTRLTIKFKYIFLLSTVLVIVFFILSYKEGLDIVDEHYPIANSEGRFSINTKGCRIPGLNPLDESIKEYVSYPYSLPRCLNSNNPLLASNRSKIWIKFENFHYYKINVTSKLTCCYNSFTRPVTVEDIRYPKLDDEVKYEFCVKFDESIKVSDEFVRITCSVGAIPVYEQYFLFAPDKKFIKHEDVNESSKNKVGYNILILGIDAVSRMNFHRTMPKTASYLKAKGAVEFMGFNKVGDNTFPNLIPMLMGIKVTELKKTCYPHSKVTFDNCPFVWEWFKQAGYYTALGEDSPNLGTFNYAKKGFNNAPTDYYIHTFMNEADKNVGNQMDFNSNLCIHDKYFYKVLLDYVDDLTWRLKYKKLFGFFWEISMSHDYLNYPMKMDTDYLEFFTKLEVSGYLSNTIVFFASDHGIRWGKIRHTKQGRLEERLPTLYILTPQSFRQNYSNAYNNLKLNGRRLTTPFDVHATLSDLVDLKNVENIQIGEKSSRYYADSRSISLFLPIPENRTCRVADIDDHWCTCHEETAMQKDGPKGFEVANQLVMQLNSMLKIYPQCATLTVSEILGVTEIEAGEPDANEKTWKEFTVVVKTSPGGGVFEATLRQDAANQSWKLVGTASRLNLYGDQSKCVNNYEIKLYCYCR